jgi:hypothetical protein
VKSLVWDRFNSCGGVSFSRYSESNMKETSHYLKIAIRFPSLARGFHWLSRIRLGCFWTTHRLAQIGWVSSEFKDKCPFCLGYSSGGEDIMHFLLICPRWAQVRNTYLDPLVNDRERPIVYTNLLGGSSALGGMSLAEVVDWWCPTPLPDVSNESLSFESQAITSSPESISQESSPSVLNRYKLSGCVLVAKYLQQVIPLRFAMLKPLLEAPGADADNGMAVFQSNNDIDMVNIDIVLAADTRRGTIIPE